MPVAAAAPPPGWPRQQRRERVCAGRRRPGGAARPRASPPPARLAALPLPSRFGRSLKQSQVGQRRRRQPPPVTSAGEDLIGRRKYSAGAALLWSRRLYQVPTRAPGSRRPALKPPQLFCTAPPRRARAGQDLPSPPPWVSCFRAAGAHSWLSRASGALPAAARGTGPAPPHPAPHGPGGGPAHRQVPGSCSSARGTRGWRTQSASVPCWGGGTKLRCPRWWLPF